MTRRKVIAVLKWVWIAAVLIGAGFYFQKNFLAITSQLASLVFSRILLGFFLLLIGKLLISDVTRLSLKRVGIFMPYQEALSITAVTQLGKYIPGGIWHFAGKFAAYKARGLSTKDATRVMLWENGWLLTAAGVVGTMALFLVEKELIYRLLPFLKSVNRIELLIWTLPILWICGMIIMDKILFKRKIRYQDFLLCMGEQILIWIIFGLSLWLAFPPDTTAFPLAIGAFSFSWVAGYAAIFAPGGLGVREFVLVILLGGFFSNFEVTAFAAVHRLMWVAVEILLGAGAALLFGIPLIDEKEQKSEPEK